MELKQGLKIGNIPPTPGQPFLANDGLHDAKRILFENAFALGYPVSYIQEQKGSLIQNIIPVHKTEYEQISTSSKVQLALHTEAAFHPYKPDYVMLLCLRGDPTAVTTYANVDDIIELLDNEMISYLQDSAYRTGVDKSFRGLNEKYKEVILPVLKKIGNDEYNLSYDEDLMKPTNILANCALEKLSEAVSKCTKEIVLKTGDLLIMNNNKIIHGRKPFQARYDGTDRWVQRILVRKELPPADQIDGHVITTKFGA